MHAEDKMKEYEESSTENGGEIDVIVTANEKMEDPGFIGVGWGAQVMNGAEIWFCTVSDDVFYSDVDLCPKKHNTERMLSAGKPAFSCCLAAGNHALACRNSGDDTYYELEVIDWCLSKEVSSVTVRAPICRDQENQSRARRNCFLLSSTPDGQMDFIIAYNPLSRYRSHGYQRRTAAQVDLRAGSLTQSEAEVADTGLIATHGAFMLFGWMICAPWGIFVSHTKQNQLYGTNSSTNLEFDTSISR